VERSQKRRGHFWRSNWLVAGWLTSVVLVGLSIFTPVELVPLPLENVPRWGLYGLVFPACGLLRARWPRVCLLWQTVPWLVWGPLLAVLFFWLPATLAQTPAKPWANIVAPLTWLFARPEEWRTSQVLFRRGPQLVVEQRYVPWNQVRPRLLRGAWRTAVVTPLVPGVQWAAPLPGPGCLDASWHAQPLPALNQALTRSAKFHRFLMLQAQLKWSGDTALQRRLLVQLPPWVAQLPQERKQDLLKP
jgi:hypothetical protein